jgi:hypothetical protein
MMGIMRSKVRGNFKRVSDFVGMVLVIAIFLAVAAAGVVMIAVPVPILLHFLSTPLGFGQTGGKVCAGLLVSSTLKASTH